MAEKTYYVVFTLFFCARITQHWPESTIITIKGEHKFICVTLNKCMPIIILTRIKPSEADFWFR